MSQKRQPKGTETGGQFAADVNPESTVVLDDSTAVDFGDVSNVQEGSRTPWGTADYVNHPAPGVAFVGTPGHGGVKLSPERNKKIPPALRSASGWYEEDCEVYIPMMFHPDAMRDVEDEKDIESIREQGEQGVVRWFPEQYEAMTGVEIPTGVSASKDEKTWNELHKNDFVAISAIGVDSVSAMGEDVEMVEVTVRRGGRGNKESSADERVILVSRKDYDDTSYRQPLGLHNGSFIPPRGRQYKDVTPPPKAPNPPAPRYREVDTSGLSSDARRRAERDLAKQFRFRDGSDGDRVQSVREIIESGGIVGKSSMENNGRRTYYLRHAQEAEGQPATDTFYALEVSKALWDSVNAPAS